MRWWTIWVSALLLLHMAGHLSCAKDHPKKVAHKEEAKKETVPRFTIPHPNHPESAFIPEAIGQSVGNEKDKIVGTELPGAYGEDYDMEGGFESGSGVTSGSGSGRGEKDSESPESPGKYGTNMVHSNPPINPSSAFVGNENQGGEEEEEKEDVDLGKELDADDGPKEEKDEKEEKEEKEEKKDDEPSPLPEATSKTESKKETKEESVKVVKKAEKHHSKAEKSSKVAKKKTKTKAKTKNHDENNMISKIDAIAKQIERVEHREKLDRKEAATLKVAKKVAKKVIKNINAKKKHKKTHKISHKASNFVSQALSQAFSHKSFDEFAEDDDKPPEKFSHKKEKTGKKEEPKALEISAVRATPMLTPPVDTSTVDPNFKYWMEALRKQDNPPPAPKIDMHEAVLCSTSHPYAFHNGSHCCATQEDNEGGKLTIHSTSCKGMKTEECASVTCKDNDLSIGPEGFECPWACFWTCHSYCPKECCNNPFKCDLGCREFCTPYCTDRCCAPGSQRLPKLQINFNNDDERKNISAIFAEDDRHQLPANISAPAAPTPHEKEEEDAKLHTRLDPAENSYQQLKEQEHQIALANQIEALKKATSYAAQLMGLPPECPLACARICLPGLCKQQCCARSQIPNVPIVPPAAFQTVQNPLANFNPAIPIPSAERAPIVPGPQVTPSRNQLALANQFAMAQKQRYLMAHNQAAAAALQQRNANAYMMNKLALQNRLLEGKNDFVPALARYRAMQYANQMNRQKMLLKNNLESQASRQQIADAASHRCEPGYPCQQQQQQQQRSSSSSASPSWLHNCPPICRSSCIPQCPNECCAHATRGAPSMK